MMQTLEFLSGTGLLLTAFLAAQRHKTKVPGAAWRLLAIGAVATAGAVLLMTPVRQQLHRQQKAPHQVTHQVTQPAPPAAVPPTLQSNTYSAARP